MFKRSKPDNIEIGNYSSDEDENEYFMNVN